MSESVKHRLLELCARDSERRALEDSATQLRADLGLANLALIDAEERAGRELEDVRRLEGLRLSKVVRLLMGDLEQRLEKERSEHVAAVLKVEQQRDNVAKLEGALARLRDRGASLAASARSEAEEIEAISEALVPKRDGTTDRVVELMHSIGESRQRLHDFKDAIEAGRETLHHFESASSHLASAEGWGIANLFSGLSSSLVKFDVLDLAHQDASNAMGAMTAFRRRLHGLGIGLGPTQELQGAGRFLDVFVDGLVVNLFTLRKIRSSVRCVDEMARSVERALGKVEAGHSTLQAKTQAFERELDVILNDSPK